MTKKSAASNQLFGAIVPIVATFGLLGEEMRRDYARLRLPFNPAFTNSRGELHGGAILTLLDCSLACAARSHDSAATAVMTIDLSTHFMTSARGDLIGEARCLKRGRSIVFTQCEVHDLDGNLVATATASMKLIPRRPEAIVS
jgi:uncharacterized protein (TIGR00369 family)